MQKVVVTMVEICTVLLLVLAGVYVTTFVLFQPTAMVGNEPVLSASSLAIHTESTVLQGLLSKSSGTGYSIEHSSVYYLSSGAASILPADVQTFRVLGADNFSWAKDQNAVYLYGKPVEEIDATTFEVHDSGYAKDAYGVYMQFGTKVERVPNVQVATFTAIPNSTTYFADSENVWFKQESGLHLVATSAVQNFSLLKEPYYTDGIQVYIFGEPIKEARVSTFTAVGSVQADDCTNYIAKDHKNVYQTADKKTSILAFASPREFILPVQLDAGLRLARDQDTVFMGKCALQKVHGLRNIFTARPVVGSIVNDGYTVYTVQDGIAQVIQNIDAGSFSSAGANYFVDATSVYYSADLQILPGVASKAAEFNGPYVYTKQAVFCNGVPLLNVQSQSFRVLTHNYATDGATLWRACKVIQGVQDQATVTLVNDFLITDSKALYIVDVNTFALQTVAITNFATFEVLDTHFARDSEHVYYFSADNEIYIVENADPLTFISNGKGIGIDASGIYDATSLMEPVSLLPTYVP